MNQGKICVSICGETANEVLGRIERAAQLADVIEIRFDCLRPEDIPSLVERLGSVDKQVLITFRPAEQGGTRPLSIGERTKFWEFIQSNLHADNFLVDHEFDMNFSLQIGNERAIVSMHDFAGPGNGLQQRLDALTGLAGKTIKMAVTVDDAVDGIQVWKLLGQANDAVIPIAMGEAGKWTRILGLAHGAPMTYASLDSADGTAPGQIPAADLRDVFRANELDEETSVYGVIAEDTNYSLSPYMHNAAFRSTGINSVFVPLQVRDLDGFMRRMVNRETRELELNFRGFAVTNPHKQAIVKYLDFVDETAQKIGAVNTVKIDDGKLSGFNTDANGFIEPLRKIYGSLKDARVTVAGAGGAARACVYALLQEGALVTLLARDARRAAAFAEEFGVKSSALTTDHRPLTADILVNTTPVGTAGGSQDMTIATADELHGVKLVYDLVYNPEETRLIREAKRAGSKTLGGIEMLIAQGAQQFSIWTGENPPVDEMKAAVNARLNQTNAA